VIAPRGLYGMIDVPARGEPPRPSPSPGGVTKGETPTNPVVAMADTIGGAIKLACALVDGGASMLQLRMKDASGAELYRLAYVLRPLCRELGVPFIVNDRLDVALAVAADGVHLGQDDLPLAAARPLVPAGFVIGVSTHNEAQARAAIAGGADYLGFGPCFPTHTKRNPDPVVGLEQLAFVSGLGAPVVAIGGITLDTIAAVAASGCAAAAVIRAVNSADDVALAARFVTSAFAR
jgi:thiamine-phosphate pyrophosphorylase